MKYTIPLDKCMPAILGKHAKWQAGCCDGLDYFSDYCRPYSSRELADMRGHKYTQEQIDADDDLKDALTQAARRLDELADQDGAYKSHRDMCERVVLFLQNELNDLACDESKRDAFGDRQAIALSIDWREQVLCVDLIAPKACARVVLDIVNSEGIFHFDDLADFMQSGPFKDAIDLVRSHEHYLLNLPLIMDIWGAGSRSMFEYRECYGSVDEADIKECMDEAISEYADKVKERDDLAGRASLAYGFACAAMSQDDRDALEAYAPALKKLI